MANRILLADDSITIQKVVNLTFADEGIEVIAVSNGDQAERRLADVQPDLVLADIFMPGKNGYELCETIKNSEHFHYTPVVLLVGAFEPFDQAEARRVKADAHLTKPFESRTLVDTVRRLINASGQPRTGPLPPLPAPDAKAEPLTPPSLITPSAPLAAPPAEPRSAPMTQPFSIDMSAMSNPAAPPAVTPSAALDFSYGATEDPLAVPIEVQVGDAPAGETTFAAQSNAFHRTDDLSFADTQPPFEALGLDELFAEPPASNVPQSFAPSGSATPHQAGGHEGGVGVPSMFGYATEEMLLDLDQPAPAVTHAAQEPFAFDIEEREAASVDASGIQPDASAVETAIEVAAEPAAMQTTMLEAPHTAPYVEGPVNTNPLEIPAHAATESSEAAFADAVLDQSALFNVDDPLGDVLDEGTLAAATSETASAAPVEALHAEAVITDVAPQPEAPAVSSQSPMDYAVEFPAEPLAEAFAPEPPASAQASEPAFEMQMPPVEPAAETGFGFTPVEELNTGEAETHAHEPRFTTASMWTNEEARFAAIDIEATPVEEHADAAPAALAETAAPFVYEEADAYITHAERPAAKAAPVAETPAAPLIEEATASAPPAPEVPATATATTAAPAVELSPALIDEIVRRVVAQMSESVVREIAWEVVPDCVERVIKQMTAQELAKR